MKKEQKRKVHDRTPVRKTHNVSDDTLEFLSLDDETIAVYERKMQPASSKKSVPHRETVKAARKQEIYEEDIDDEDDEIEELDDIEEENYDEVDDDDRYYETDEEEDERYYESDEDDDDDYYAVDDDDRYYEEDDRYYEDDDRYYEGDEEDDDLYYEMEDEDDDYYGIDEEDDDEEYYEENIFARFGHFITSMSAVDYIVAAFGIFILVAAVAIGTVYFNARGVSEQVEAFSEIGTEIQDISIIGESGLIAVADAESARMSQMMGLEPEMTAEEQSEMKPNGDQIEVGINLTSIQSDIKVKFVNKGTNKLIGSVPFEVEITGGGKTFSLKDDDKDGIIHQTGISAGTYTVKVMALSGGDYEKYRLPVQEETIKVTDTIAYKKVEVADEIKTEAEVNAAVEDTAQQNTVVESALKDTVEWVESAKTEENADNNYEEIKRENVPDPVTLARAGAFVKLVNSSSPGDNVKSIVRPEQPAVPSTGTGDTATVPSTGTDTTNTPSTSAGTTETPSTGAGATETPSTSTGTTETPPTSTGTTETPSTSTGTTETPSTSTETTETPSTSTGTTNTPPAGGSIVSPEQPAVPANPTNPAGPTDAEKLSALNPVLNTKSLALTKGGSATLSVSVTGNEPYTVEWSSSSPVASVNSGVVTGAETGTAVITATVRVGEAAVPLNCTVTVTEAAVKYTAIKVEGNTAIQMGSTGSLKGTTTPEGGSIIWSSDNTNVVKIDEKGVMTGVSEGTAVITAICGDAKATWQVKVTKNYIADTVTKLKDKDGNQVYIKNSEGKYVEAVYADYYKDQMLYLRKANAECFYTGWQTIDGYTYFFDKNGKYVTGEQVIQGAKYSFDSQGRMSSNSGVLGIDVSKWNGSIDWNAVKNSGVSYVIIRCGYRGSSTGALIEDPKFASNIKGAKAAGLKVGVYFFSQAVNEAEAVEEASMALNLVSGYGLEYPVFLDVEASNGRGDAIDVETRTAVCKAFCATIQNSGYKAGVYANTTWFTSKINAGSLTGYKIWLAQYASAPTYTATKYDMWQYTSKGSVSGISGSVDMNISYLNY